MEEMVFPSFPANSYLAASIGGLVCQDVVFDCCSGWLPGDQCALPGDFTGCQVGRRIQDCQEEKMQGHPYLASASLFDLRHGNLVHRAARMLTLVLAWMSA